MKLIDYLIKHHTNKIKNEAHTPFKKYYVKILQLMRYSDEIVIVRGDQTIWQYLMRRLEDGHIDIKKYMGIVEYVVAFEYAYSTTAFNGEFSYENI